VSKTMKILVAEPLFPAAIERLEAQPAWEVILAAPETFAAHIADCDALIVRTVKVTADLIAKASKLRVIGRAGGGSENIDIDAATDAGVLVMNTPGGNAVSVAEHTLALMLALARSIPLANEATKSGKWEMPRFPGTELRGKTLGIVGLGAIGREVAKRARALEMRIIAADPFVNPVSAADMGIELMGQRALWSQSDYITLHVALTPATQGMINEFSLAEMKRGVRIVNCARGELIDTVALAKALQSGHVGGAALDVFQTEPPSAGEPLLKLDNVIATPHIGGATEEAQEIVGGRIVEQLIDYLQNGVVTNAVNLPSITTEQYRALGPYITLAERLGAFASHVSTGNPRAVRVVYIGRVGGTSTNVIRNAAIAGVLNRSLTRRANIVNSMQIATDRGISVGESHESRGANIDSIRVEIDTDSGRTTAEGAILLNRPRLLQIDGIPCEAPLSGNVTYMKNADVPGVIGYIGTVLGRNQVNIGSYSLGRIETPPGQPATAVSVVQTDQEVPEQVLVELLSNPALMAARPVRF
jgi:D-3-phosphoglycerate dehydrogenase / 2-oxoglutarate reductase